MDLRTIFELKNLPYLDPHFSVSVDLAEREGVDRNVASALTFLIPFNLIMSQCPPYAPFFGFGGVASAVSNLGHVTKYCALNPETWRR